MGGKETAPVVQIRLDPGPDQGSFVEPEAWQFCEVLREAAGPNANVDMVRATPPPFNPNIRNMMGIEAVVASIALPSIAFVAKALRDVIVNYLKAKGTRSVEITTSDGRSVKITGPEASSDRVLEILQTIAAEKQHE